MQPTTESDEPNPSFDTLGLDPRALLTLTALGFEKPTPIQAATIPTLLAGRDVVGRARTGSGKTAAFGLPLLERVRGAGKGLRALVLAPTRELALQVTSALRELSGKDGVQVATIYGGSSYRPQLEALSRGVPVIVGTPGRLIDHLEKGRLDLSKLEFLVVDEADEMLRQGFLEEVERLLDATPDTRQIALFSATMPSEIRRIAKRKLNDPVTIEVETGSGPTVNHITQAAIRVPNRFKVEALVRLLRGEERGTTLVFSRTRHGCAEVAEELLHHGLAVDAMHGDLGQDTRERVLGRLRSGSLDIVVATDVAARGIDVEHITHVINMDLPGSAEIYAHRIGRTGRAGREGKAITFVTPQEVRRFQGMVRQLNAEVMHMDLPSDADIGRRGRKGLGAALRKRHGEDLDDGPRAYLANLLEDEDWTAEDVAAAALDLLAERGGLSLHGEPEEELPYWARPRPQRHEQRSQMRDHRGPPDRGPQQRGGPPGGHGDNADEVQLFVAIGRGSGVRPADVVGALANDTGIPGNLIGRISIFENKALVGLSRANAQKILASHDSLNVRGQQARMALARNDVGYNGPPRGQQQRPPQGDRYRRPGPTGNRPPRHRQRRDHRED